MRAILLAVTMIVASGTAWGQPSAVGRYQVSVAVRIIVGGKACGFVVDYEAINDHLMRNGTSLAYMRVYPGIDRIADAFAQSFENNKTAMCAALFADHGSGGKFNPTALSR